MINKSVDDLTNRINFDSAIRTLRDEATVENDLDRVRLSCAALKGDKVARIECLRILKNF
jgi:hypothetical protein